MLTFDSAPAIPETYAKLRLLSATELAAALADGYVERNVDPSQPVRRAGKDFGDQPLPTNNIADWRTRIYIIWFCYIYEHLHVLHSPLGAIEELILEFKAPAILDTANCRLATEYAGASNADPLFGEKLRLALEHLKPHYDLALKLLDAIDPNEIDAKEEQ